MNTIYKDSKDMYHPPYKYSLAYQEFAHSLSFTYSILAELHPRQSLYSYVFCYAQKMLHMQCRDISWNLCCHDFLFGLSGFNSDFGIDFPDFDISI